MKTNIQLKTIALLILSLVLPAQSVYAVGQIHEFKLDNGLKVLVKPIRKAPVASVQLWYKVGSSYEHAGISGVSHMLEHFMFKGTKRFPNNTFTEQVTRIGGNQNAFTSRDFTAYYQNVSKQHVETMIQMEADRMRNIVFNAAEFAKEKQVVAEERRLRTDDSVTGRLFELHRLQAYTINPNRIPVIGWMTDIDNYQLQDIQQWYNRWYYPNNAILVVVGDVDPEQIHQWAKQYYGIIPAHPILRTKPRIEPKQQARIINEMNEPTRTPQTLISFRTPSFGSTDKSNYANIYALMMLAAILDGSASSRLPVNMVQQNRSVASISASYNPYAINPVLFSFYATSNGNRTLLQIEQEILDHIQTLQQQPASQQELERILAQVKAAYVYEQDSLFYQGYELGALETMELGWQLGDSYLDRLQQVTPRDIQLAAQTYLDLDKTIITRLNREEPQ